MTNNTVSRRKNQAQVGLRSNLNKGLFAGSGMPLTEMERSNLWDTSEDQHWDKSRQRVSVRLGHDDIMKDKEKLAQLSGEVVTYNIKDLPKKR